jgi:hypothetical protein
MMLRKAMQAVVTDRSLAVLPVNLPRWPLGSGGAGFLYEQLFMISSSTI